MKVMKFGGSVLHHEVGFQAMVDIIQKQNGKHLIVISAFSDITRRLDASMNLALNQSHEMAMNEIQSILDYHTMLTDVLIPNNSVFLQLLDATGLLLQRLLKGITLTKEISPKIRDFVLAQGEILSTVFVKELLLKHSIDVDLIDAGEIMLTDSVHGHAKPQESLLKNQIYSTLIPAFQNHKNIIIAGFIGKNSDGDITTMGYESSNLTAALIGSLINVDEIIIWTDVSGIRSADPKYIVNTKNIPSLEYAEAQALSNNGLKLLHHWMLDAPMKHAIPVCIANAFDDLGEKTAISHKHSQISPSIIIRHNQDIDDYRYLFNADESSIERISVFTTNQNIIHSIYELASTISLTHRIIIRTYESPNMHHLIMQASDIEFAMNTLHSLIEEHYETPS